MNRSTPLAVLTVGILIASTSAILFKLAERSGAPALVIAAGRLTLASLILTPVAWGRAGTQIRRIGRRDAALTVAAGVLLAIHFASWFASLVYTSVASSSALVATIPIWVAAASVFLFGERLPRQVVLGILIAFAGSVVIGFSDSGGAATGSNPLLGDALALVGAVGAASYYLVGRSVQRRVSLLPYIWLCYGTAALVLLGWALLSGASFAGYGQGFWLAVLGLAVGPQLLGHTAFNWSLRHLSATFVSVAALGEPIGSTLLAWLILDQTPRPLQLVGGAVLLAGIFVATSGEKSEVRIQKSESLTQRRGDAETPGN
ncbi:MAG TPA: DMT family transporter [Herpetosiphonaceae bacterium]|nr:DMT family transporter [Herpetosiphonaceae bacterium]